MFNLSRLSRLITVALASCAVTGGFAAGAVARPDAPNTEVAPNAEVAPPPVYKVVRGDTDKVPSASTAPAYQPAIGDRLKTPDRAAVDRNLAGLSHGGKTPGVVVAANTDDSTDTIALVTAIVALLVALAAATFIAIRPQRPVLRT